MVMTAGIKTRFFVAFLTEKSLLKRSFFHLSSRDINPGFLVRATNFHLDCSVFLTEKIDDMPNYRLLAVFALRRPDYTEFESRYEDVVSCGSSGEAEEKLEIKISEMISEYSVQSFEWTLLEKCITQEDEREFYNRG